MWAFVCNLNISENLTQDTGDRLKKNLKIINIEKLQNDTSLSLSISELVSRNMERYKVCCITAVNGAGLFIYNCLQTICQYAF